jgi:hypothetical protein
LKRLKNLKLIKTNYTLKFKKIKKLKSLENIINKDKKEANKLGVSASVFVGRAIAEKIENRNKLNKIEKRLNNLEKKI